MNVSTGCRFAFYSRVVSSLTLRDIRKKLGANAILKGIDLAIADGELAVLVGPSGCGKSTLLRTIAGLEEPDDGTITLGDRDVTHMPPRDRDIAMVFQSYALYPHLTVRDNIAFGLRLRATPEADVRKRVDDVAAMLSIGHLLDRFPREMSGGQRQRVAMGRAIARRPQASTNRNQTSASDT
jgi:ABC-type sugar transport system ATPase subunit